MKPKSRVWKLFTEIKEGSRVKGKCGYCLATYVTNATRMANHIVKCEKATSAAKEAVMPQASKEAAKIYRNQVQSAPASTARSTRT